MKQRHVKQLLLLAFFTSIVSCGKIETVSPVPEIRYLDFNIGDCTISGSQGTCGVLEFEFIDGDADLGMAQEWENDTTISDTIKNWIFVTFFKKTGINQYEQVYFTEEVLDSSNGIPTIRLDTLDFYYFVPYSDKFERVGQNKTVEGIIRIELQLFPQELIDSFRLGFYIRDRAFHKSNYEYSDDFLYPINFGI